MSTRTGTSVDRHRHEKALVTRVGVENDPRTFLREGTGEVRITPLPRGENDRFPRRWRQLKGIMTDGNIYQKFNLSQPLKYDPGTV